MLEDRTAGIVRLPGLIATEESRMARGRKATTGGRGSAEAIEKRRVARQLNTLFSGQGKRGGGLDGRTEKRRQRLLKELRDGRNGKPLKAIEIVSRADELMALGETVSSIRKNGVKLPKVDLPQDAPDVVRRAQEAYSFNPDAWKLLGIQVEERAAEPAPRRKAAQRSPGRPATKKGRRRTAR
jgi:hypothetical protein